MTEGFHVDLAALARTARGVDGVLGQVAARDVATIDGILMRHPRLAAAVTDFCDRWAFGVELLCRDAEQIRDRLDHCVAAYRAADGAAHDQLSGPGPDPGATRTS